MTVAKPNDYLKIGEAARRSGVAASTLRFYETRGLIQAHRGTGNQRIYHRSMLRRISIIRVGQTLGLSLNEINTALNTLPNNRTPTQRDWEKLSKKWHRQLEERINQLQLLRDKLTGCIGCGCLSLKRCTLYNAGDVVSSKGTGPRYLLGDTPANGK